MSLQRRKHYWSENRRRGEGRAHGRQKASAFWRPLGTAETPHSLGLLRQHGEGPDEISTAFCPKLSLKAFAEARGQKPGRKSKWNFHQPPGGGGENMEFWIF